MTDIRPMLRLPGRLGFNGFVVSSGRLMTVCGDKNPDKIGAGIKIQVYLSCPKLSALNFSLYSSTLFDQNHVERQSVKENNRL